MEKYTDAKILFEKGKKLYNSDEYKEAMECFIKAIEADSNYTEAFTCLRVASNTFCYHNNKNKSLLEEIRGKYDEIEQKHKTNVDVYLGWGYCLYKYSDCKLDNNAKISLLNQALEKTKKAKKIDSNSALVHQTLGSIYSKLGYVTKKELHFASAIEEYKKAQELFCRNAGTVNKESIKELNEIDKAIELGSNYVYIFGVWGRTLIWLTQLDQFKSLLRKEFKDYEEISIREKDSYVFIRKCVISLILGRKDQAKKYFEESGQSILEILALLYDENEEIIEKDIFLPLLDSDTFEGHFFQETTKDKAINENTLIEYKRAYILSIIIMSKLYVRLKKSKERYVAHYIEKYYSQKMLFENEKLRLNSINYSNDPTEGKILLDFLYNKNERPDKEKLKSEYGIFAGCFSFNYDSLNQFRLYGKEKDKEEGVGLSLVFKDNFFSDIARLAMDNDPKSTSLAEEKSALFRCIYIDPDEQRVVTVGQKEEYIFYQERNHNQEKYFNKDEIEYYKTFIGELVVSLEDKMIQLKNLVNDSKHKLKSEVIGNLLINLRYLVKHVAFKEEQECRIIKIYRLNKEDVILDGYERIYHKYKPDVNRYIKEIYFGPKATKMELFQDILIRKGIDISCIRSKNPLA